MTQDQHPKISSSATPNCWQYALYICVSGGTFLLENAYPTDNTAYRSDAIRMSNDYLFSNIYQISESYSTNNLFGSNYKIIHFTCK